MQTRVQQGSNPWVGWVEMGIKMGRKDRNVNRWIFGIMRCLFRIFWIKLYLDHFACQSRGFCFSFTEIFMTVELHNYTKNYKFIITKVDCF